MEKKMKAHEGNNDSNHHDNYLCMRRCRSVYPQGPSWTEWTGDGGQTQNTWVYVRLCHLLVFSLRQVVHL